MRTVLPFCHAAWTGFMLVLAMLTVPASAGGNLQSTDRTHAIDLGGGRLAVEVIDIRWDPRCIPVAYALNDTLDPIPNPLGPDVLSLRQAGDAFRAGFRRWNRIATSAIEMKLTDRVSNPGRAGFDFVNELTFRVPPEAEFLATSPSVTLLEDTRFRDGDDIDQDGDSDVSRRIRTCRDVDGDGDIEFPTGLYPAGTILDNDVLFNADVARFTYASSAIDREPASVDLRAVATHEFGHSHGLSHSYTNQIGPDEGGQPTMWPFINTAEIAHERALRSLEGDDVAHSSRLYPEPQARRARIPFAERFGTVTGEVTDGRTGLPVAGAVVYAVRLNSDKRVASAFSGTTRCVDEVPGPGGCALVFSDPAVGVIDGRYELPLPPGRYRIGIEGIDGLPTDPRHNIATALGQIYEQTAIPEEFFDPAEGAFEADPGAAEVVRVRPGRTVRGIDLVTNVTRRIAGFGTLDRVDLRPGRLRATRIPNADLRFVLRLAAGAPVAIHGATFLTVAADTPSTTRVPVFARALITTGRLNDDGTATLELDDPLVVEAPFVGQHFDQTPLFAADPAGLARRVGRALKADPALDLFLVLESRDAPANGLGASTGEAEGGLVGGQSFISGGGNRFRRVRTLDWIMTLELADLPATGRNRAPAAALPAVQANRLP